MTPYWNDAAYVAERVLTLDELKQYVDAQAPATPAPARPKVFDLKDGDDYYGWARQHPFRPLTACACCWRGAWCARA